MTMTDAMLPAHRFVEGDFRVGRVVGRTSAIFSRNFLKFFVVTAIASLPMALLSGPADDDGTARSLLWAVFGLVLVIGLSTLSQAIVLYGAFQDMRGRPVDLSESLQVGLRRFFPVLGLVIAVTVLGIVGFALLVVPGFIWFTKWFVAMPACVVEQLGVSASMARSAQLTKGNRWKIFGLMLLVIIPEVIVDNAIDAVLSSLAGGIPAVAAHVIWGGVWGAFYAICAVVTYHDLRVAKEGVDTRQVAAVFE
jgi:Membrane domain of glycerophosphoryl diester phosphodiesterase